MVAFIRNYLEIIGTITNNEKDQWTEKACKPKN